MGDIHIHMMLLIINSFRKIISLPTMIITTTTTKEISQHTNQHIRQNKYNPFLYQQQTMKGYDLFIFLFIYYKFLCEYLLW